MRHANRHSQPLIWCAVAIAASWILIAVARTPYQTTPDPPFAVGPLSPRHQSDDSWDPIARAYHYVREPHEVGVYRQLFLTEHVKFQYPMPSLFLMVISDDPVALNGISVLMIAVTALLVVFVVEDHVRRGVLGDGVGDVSPGWPGRVFLVLAMVFTFHPLVWAYRLGQVQVWLTAGYCAAVLLWIRGREGWAGLLVGMLTLVKPQFGLLLVWGGLRRRWSFVATGVTIVLVGVAAAIVAFGLDNTTDYLTLLTQLSRRGESYVANQSANGLLNRLVGHDREEWRVLPPYNPWVHAGTAISSLILVALSLAGPIRAKGKVPDLLIASLTSALASPVVWRHHYSILLPAFGMLFVAALRRPVWGRWTLPYLCACYSAIGLFQGSFSAWNYSWLNVLQSYTFFGGLGVLLYLYRLASLPWMSNGRQM